MNDATTTTTTNGKAVDERWPTAGTVAAKLGCSRQQVYRLEKRGKLRARDVRENGVKRRRFDPSTVRDLAEAQDELEALLESEEPDDDDDPAQPLDSRLANRAIAELQKTAVDARRGQQEAFDLVVKPVREFSETMMRALEQAQKRNAELEQMLSKMHDEQREARLEEREQKMIQDRVARSDARKDEFFKLFTDNVPIVLTQLKESMQAGGGPFAKWMKEVPPEKQKKLIVAIEAVLGDEDEPTSASAPEKDTQ